MIDVPIGYRKEEFVSGTVHHGQKAPAAMKDVPNYPRKEEFVADMVPTLRLAAMKDVPIR